MFLREIVSGLLVVFSCRPPKLNEELESVITGGANPLPASAMLCERSASLTVSEPCAVPSAVGEKVTLSTHDDPAASELPHVLLAANGPLTDVPIDVSGTPPEFVSVSVSGAEVCWITVPGKVRLVAESVSVAAAIPVPVSGAVWVPALSTSVNVPLAAPVAVGEKLIETEQAVLAASELPQPLETI